MSLRSDAHVLLAKRLDMSGDVGVFLLPLSDTVSQLGTYSTNQLLRQRNLLKLHLMNSGRSGAKQRTGCDESDALHACDNYRMTDTSESEKLMDKMDLT